MWGWKKKIDPNRGELTAEQEELLAYYRRVDLEHVDSSGFCPIHLVEDCEARKEALKYIHFPDIPLAVPIHSEGRAY